MMTVKARTHNIGIALYSLPFLAILAFSLFVMSAGVVEIVVTSVALLPALLHFFGVRWCRYVVAVFAALALLVCSLVPFTRGSDGRYFWLIWSPIWLAFAFSSFISLIPAQQKSHDAA